MSKVTALICIAIIAVVFVCGCGKPDTYRLFVYPNKDDLTRH